MGYLLSGPSNYDFRAPLKLLAVTADDFGLAQALDGGIKEACLEGIVTHVSLVANGENIEDACQFLIQHPEISAGVHLNLTDGKPLAGSDLIQPLLDKEGNFFGTHWKAAACYFARPPLLKAIEREYRIQTERLLGLGIRLRQANCHGHLHAIPSLFRLVTRLASEYQIPFVRVPEERPHLGLFFHSPREVLKGSLLAAGFRFSGKRIPTGNRWKKNSCFGLFDSGHLKLERFKGILLHLPEGFSELLCHPGYADEKITQRYSWNYDWERERALLVSNEAKELVWRSGIRLVNFSSVSDESV